MNSKDREYWSSHTESLVNSYASMYKKIIEGYADGTREVWVQDNSTGDDFSGVELEIDGQAVRYRKLTKEEELEYLDKTFDKLVKNQAEQFAKEELARNRAEAEAEEYEASEKESNFWDALVKLTDELENETKNYMEREMSELKELLSQGEPEIDIEGRMEVEAYNHRMETIARGQRQAQYANYRKISQMVSDMQTLLGNIRA